MLNIKFDYTYDNGFFNDPERREVLSYAGQLWSEIIGDDFDAIPAGSTFKIRHPSQIDETLEITLTEDIDDLLIYVGARNISGSTLGLGGPSGYSLVGDKYALRISDDFRNQGATENFEPWAGVLTFDDDDVTWNSSLEEPEPGENDLLTVALHEIGHVLGIGTASTFESLVQDQAFIGPNAINLNGGVAIPLHADDAHVEDGYSENNVLMDPTTTVGDRVSISEIDKAILSDLGYSVIGFLNDPATFALTSNSGETVTGTLLDDHIDALAGNDIVFANDGNDQILGGLGDDQLQGGGGNDCIYGETGEDFLLGQDGSDKLFGGDGPDELQGGMGSDLLVGGNGDDNLYGDEDDDILFGSLGTDYIQSGDGDDIIVSSLGIDHIATGTGADDIYAFCNGNDTWLNDFSIGVDSLYLVGSDIISKEGFLETEIPEYSNYWTFELPSATTLRIAKNENDTLVDANIFFKSSLDVAGILPQVILGSNTNDQISGDVSRDHLYAGEGADVVSAGAGDDTIELWSSSVYHSGSYAHNVITGARLSVNKKTKYSTVIDGEADADTIILTDGLNGDAFFLHDAYSDLHQSVTTVVDGKGMQTAARVINIETIFAGSGDDIIDLTSDTFDMGGTNITLKGEVGDDVLWAAEGNDTLEGGAGNDTLFGGAGNDILTGGSGADVFEFSYSNKSQSDIITDYTSVDTLKFYLSDGDSQITEANYQSGTLSWGNLTITLDGSLDWDDLNIVSV